MNFKWETAKLGELLELIIDHRGKTPKKMGFDDFHTDGYPVLSAKHVKTEGLTNLESLRFANEQMYRKWMKEEVQEGDIILTSEAPLGELFYIADNKKYLLGQRVFGLRPNKKIVNPLYLFCWLASRRGQDALFSKATGSTVIGIKQSELLKIEVDLPPSNIQNKIADISHCLTKKINNGKNKNIILEEMAKSLFKSWFVDFEPVKAKIAALDAGGTQEDAILAAMTAISGKDSSSLIIFKNKHPKKYIELREIAELFPSAVQSSDYGYIPQEWKVVRLSDIATLNYGKSLKKTQRINGLYPVYGSGGVTGCHDEYIVTGPGVIIGRKGSIGTVYWEDNHFFPIDTVYYVLNDKNTPLVYLYYLLRTLNLHNMNTDAAVPGLNRDNAYRLEVIKPPKDILECFSKYAAIFREDIYINNNLNKTLIDVRDGIIPKLLSGEISLQERQ
ncbi:restriction endonuclease subunit S [Salmonella enterica subsp. enterica]|uniref:restriction endonuclease subunit S n=1 Tax=Salmonella enterica TaxID=28901 RepID=UPI00107E2D06|nr:restriction endonuclease subunit S [Salmonella enterica]EAB8291638.1 restriction endonuclease subunit S [Salmonella enterica subsp. enterica serovar Bracknell]ECE6019375.1 restriction endonuclease subunit S [Salmonella enterica subsp. enterica]ECJ4520473.1 restriction endonuclease subunit S [Salmonella enterica subsp. enterica]EDR0073494.1 restriction endonuclease subunit S [Salmonella enterica subsp. enterica]EHB7347371.1 restriction endonuclease subunit S [Salmonella enterica subsp. enter